MLKFTLSILFIISIFLSNFYFSQNGNELNKFSIEYNLGLVLKKDLNEISPKAYFVSEFASRYMFNSAQGIKFDISFVALKRDINYNSLSKSFQNRYSLQYVLDFGRLFHFERFAPDISGLLHIGGGISTLKFKESLYFKSWKHNFTDETINLVLGLTPQYRLTDRFEIHTDLTFVGNLFQEFNQDLNFKDLSSKSVFGRMINFSFGAAYYVGKKEKHCDWKYKKRRVEPVRDSVPETKTIDPIIVANYDNDNDGVMDSLDICPEEFGLLAFDGCPKPETIFDCSMNAYPIFQFKGARSEILEADKPFLDSIANCFIQDKQKKMVIYGHSDKSNEPLYTQELSVSRANSIKKELVKRGISEDRIFVVGEGSKKALISEKDFALIKHNRVAFFKTISNNQFDIQVLQTGEYLQGLFYTIQIGAFKKVIINNKFGKFGEVLIAKSTDGFIKYSIDIFQDYEIAVTKLNTLKKNGLFSDAFVTAYYLGEKITLKQAQELKLKNKE